MKISKIEVQKNNKDRVSLFVDDNFLCGLSVETVLKNNLKPGLEISEDVIDYLKNETEKQICFDKAVKYISKFAKSEKKVTEYLIKKGFENEVVEHVLKKLKEYKFVDDEFYASAFVKSKYKNSGKKKLLFQLKLNGISDEIARKSVENFSNDSESINNVAKKYLKNKPLDLKTKQKLYRHLISRGYESEDITRCLGEIFD